MMNETSKVIHILRNPAMWTEAQVREARHAAAALLEESEKNARLKIPSTETVYAAVKEVLDAAVRLTWNPQDYMCDCFRAGVEWARRNKP